nr:SCO family protein [uncultured Flavobacterium sp.]
MKKILLIFSVLLILISCDKKNVALPDDSIFHLTSDWETQDGEFIQLRDLKGNVIVMVMIYTTCKTACPRLTADMRDISQKVGNSDNKNLKYVFVSIDPEIDTPEKMREYLSMYKFTSDQWLFLRSSEANTRELANVLSVKYKEISPIDFSHSNIISVFAKDGQLAYQKEGLNIDIDGTALEVKKQLK